ncbi:hypothetical protein BE21_09500 [Sorangium cellulosum]|uniref:HTH cro/C1-type domain-containing protein n=1 Tax=Sorangium cellulosum TaxID=56 RepID=A0A150U1S4_SORCE|nr:hypothetical protein BE21_09500 [Sorangium cellulosum]
MEGRAQLSRGYVSRIIRGERARLSPDMLRRIADALEVSYEWLATGRGSNEDGGVEGPIGAPKPLHPLEAALAYHRGKWSAPAVAAARVLAKSSEVVDLEPPGWADVLDQIDAALLKIKFPSRQPQE